MKHSNNSSARSARVVKRPDSWLNAPIKILLAGCGGNGSLLLTQLARIHTSMLALGHPGGLQVTAVDPDIVTEANLGRQAFCAADLGLPKSLVLINRINLFFGTNWTGAVGSIKSTSRIPYVDLVISCMDTIAARRSLWNKLKRMRVLWMDLGNETTFGQVILGKTENIGFGRTSENTLCRRVPHLFDLHPSLLRKKDAANSPSCSVAESLQKQDLFINPVLACLAGQLLWKLFRDGQLSIHGYVANLASGHIVPMPIPGIGPQTDLAAA